MQVEILKCQHTSKGQITVSRLMPKIGGPRKRSREMLSSVMELIMLYGVSIWRKVIEKSMNIKIWKRVERRAAVYFADVHRTASRKTLQALSRQPFGTDQPYKMKKRCWMTVEKVRRFPVDASLMVIKWHGSSS